MPYYIADPQRDPKLENYPSLPSCDLFSKLREHRGTTVQLGINEQVTVDSELDNRMAAAKLASLTKGKSDTAKTAMVYQDFISHRLALA